MSFIIVKAILNLGLAREMIMFMNVMHMPIKPENKKRYPKNWKAISRFVRFYRARNKCEWCGAENYKPHPITGSKVVLTVAHVFDHNPENCSLLNLSALCQKCHIGHDTKRRKEERLAKKEKNQLTLF